MSSLWDQYQSAIEAHRTARDHVDRVDRSPMSTSLDRHRASCLAARAAQRCVVALHFYRDDLLSGIDLVSDDEDEFTTTRPGREPENRRHKIDGDLRPITDLTDEELDQVASEFARGGVSVPVLASRWQVSTFAVLVLLQSRGVIELQSPIGHVGGHTDYTIRMIGLSDSTKKPAYPVNLDYDQIAEDRKSGAGYKEISAKHDISVERARQALRQCRRRGLLPGRDEQTARYVLVARYIRDNPLKSHAEIARHFKITTRQLTADLYAAKKSQVIRRRSDNGVAKKMSRRNDE